MPDDIQKMEMIPKTWKERGVDWFFQQGTTVIVLLMGIAFLGWYAYQRDLAFIRQLDAMVINSSKMLEDRDKRFIEYRLKDAEKTAANIKGILDDQEKQYLRLERLMLEVQKLSLSTESKIRSLMP